MGRDGARRPGVHPGRGRRVVRRRLQGHRRFHQTVRRAARDRYPDLGGGDRRRGGGRGAHGPAAGRGDAIHRLHLLRLRHAHELRRDRALPRGTRDAARRAGAVRGLRARRAVPFAEPRGGVLPHPGVEDGVAAEVLDLRTLLPLDDAAIVRSVKKTNKVLIVHEDTRTGGVAGEITARINEQAFEWLDGPIMRVTAHDVPLPYAPTLEDFVLPQTDDIVKAARWLANY